MHLCRTTALMRAATQGHVEVCELLVNYGCDVNAKNSLGMTALYMAACAGHTDCCQVNATISVRVFMGANSGNKVFHN